ncbi:MAG: hypothetical protein Q9192_005496 [Flavoplaca navasiana]
MTGDLKNDWNFTSEPQRADLDVWGFLGDIGWNYDTLLPKFEKVQGARPEQEAAGLNSFIIEDTHRYGGPINASFSPGYTPILAAWPETLANLGLTPNGDPRDGLRPGVKAQLDLTAKKLVNPNEQAVETGASVGGSRPVSGRENQNVFVSGFVTTPSQEDTCPSSLRIPTITQNSIREGRAMPPLSDLLKDNGAAYAPPFTAINETTVRDLTNTLFFPGWHVVGSVPMMSKDQGGVLGPRLKVYSTKIVRVVDASIVPLRVRSNTVSLVYVIADKGADIIKADMSMMNGTVPGLDGDSQQAFTGAAVVSSTANWGLFIVVIWAATLILVEHTIANTQSIIFIFPGGIQQHQSFARI